MAKKAVLITGASTGIGRAIAIHLDKLGYQTFAGVRKTEDAESLKGESDSIHPLMLDVTNDEQINAAADQIKQSTNGSGLTGLINNAGIPVAGPLEFVQLPELRRQFEVNVIGLVAVTQSVMPLIRSVGGRIINIGSIAGRITAPFVGPYSASKHAVRAISNAMRAELQPWGIHVSLIEPGAVATPIWKKGLAWARDQRKQMPPEAEGLYGPRLDQVMAITELQDRSGIPAHNVAKVVEHALTAARPKTAYLVGTDARIQSVIARLPDRMRHKVMGRALQALEKKAKGGS